MAFKLLLSLITIAASLSTGQGQLVGSSTGTGATSIAKDENGTVEINKSEEKDLKGRMDRMESKSQRQDKEIDVLKTLLEEEKKYSKQLGSRISQLEASTNQSPMENDQLLARSKRPYRLLPPHIPLEKEDNDRERDQQFYGPATNCDELGLLGYTLNGYYLVKKKIDSIKKGKIGIIYCQFQRHQGQKQITATDMRTLVDLEDSELEVLIMDSVSKKLLPIDSKIMEQTKQIKDIFGLLGKKQNDSRLPIESKTGKIKNSRGNSSEAAKSPSPALIKSSTKSFSKLKTTTSSANKNPSVMSSSSGERNCTLHKERVECVNVPIKNIKEFFQRTDHITYNFFRSIKLSLLNGDELIPANILGNKKTEELEINYDEQKNPGSLLKVDINAFISTKYYTKMLKLHHFNGSQLDLGFLSGFDQLTDLTLLNIRHIQNSLPTLPLLPKLTSLELQIDTRLNDSIITFPTLSTGGLKTFKFSHSGMHTDASVSRILDWILLSSAKTLKHLTIDSIGITEIPSQIRSFTALNYLDLDRNSISSIKKGALRFSVPVSLLRFASNKINLFETGAFQGDFRYAFIRLDGNSLTRIEESVFRPILQQIVSGRGEIDIGGGKRIDCSTENICHLAWVVRNKKFRAKVSGKCSNGTSFGELKVNGFNHCRVTKKP